MHKPEDWDKVPAKKNEFREPCAGPCILGIVRATAGNSGSGNPQVTLDLDIADGSFKNFYRNKSERLNGNWYLKFYQGTEGKSKEYFKGLIADIEESNPGYQFDFNEATLTRKLIGANLQEEEYPKKDGSVGIKLRPAYLCSVQSIRDGGHKIWPVKKLARTAPGDDFEPPPVPPDNFDQTGSSDDLPF